MANGESKRLNWIMAVVCAILATAAIVSTIAVLIAR